MTLAIDVLTLITIINLFVNGIGFHNVKLNVNNILFNKVVINRFISRTKVALDDSVLRIVRRFNLVLFICAVKVRMKPNFFTSLHISKLHLGLFTILVIVVNNLIATVLRGLFSVPLPMILKVFSNTMAGAPTLKTKRRVLHSLNAPVRVISRVKVDCTVTCPFNVYKVLFAV